MIIPIDDNFRLLPDGTFIVRDWNKCTPAQQKLFLDSLKRNHPRSDAAKHPKPDPWTQLR